jgi:2-dehydro-3-deoxyphosphogluconate aldolase / (4S)-4-hydroxy-2-oxoglutarate aldolase
MNIDTARASLRRSRVVAIIRGTYTREQILAVSDALQAGGVTAMEVTLNSADALSHIRSLAAHAGDRMIIGAGTVRTPTHVAQAIDAGAQFLISPGFDPASVTRSLEAGVLHLPGVFTASEAQAASAMGCRMLKLFPCDTLSPVYLKALRAPLEDVEFVPTGGVNASNIADWKRAGAAAVAAGSSLVSGAGQSMSELTARAKAMRDAWEQA